MAGAEVRRGSNPRVGQAARSSVRKITFAPGVARPLRPLFAFFAIFRARRIPLAQFLIETSERVFVPFLFASRDDSRPTLLHR